MLKTKEKLFNKKIWRNICFNKKSLTQIYNKGVIPDPVSESLSVKEMDNLTSFIEKNKNILLLTGAGISTESNIPDYRSKNGAYSKGHKPITYQQFVHNDRLRRRYWARYCFAYTDIIKRVPNKAHFGLVLLQQKGVFSKKLITQNVDGLHGLAGSEDVLEIHGDLNHVNCLNCKESYSRKTIQQIMETENYDLIREYYERKLTEDKFTSVDTERPDGDVEITHDFVYERFVEPLCYKCDSIIKPNLVFFGENVPPEVRERGFSWIDECDSIIVLGTSVMVYSAFRYVRKAHEDKKPIIAINIGETRCDSFLDFKLEHRCGDVVEKLCGVLGYENELKNSMSLFKKKY